MSGKAPRGTRDILPKEAVGWHYLEEKFKQMCYIYNFQEIRTPIFEEKELFVRGVGEESDVVKKEMYTFKDRGERELALRPEGTAGVARAYIEHGLYNIPQPVKLFYYGPMFRYDRPQEGRQRQFYQMGIEIFGAGEPYVDVEVIKFTADFFSALGFKKLKLHINSVGCPQCRPRYEEKLKEFARDNLERLCKDCRNRTILNPLRLLDCKEESCRALMEGAPRLESYLCDSCSTHFNEVLKSLQRLNVSYIVDHHLVRGLDYYTKTAFEFISEEIGAQSSLGGGGRYDNLVKIFGGPPVPGVGMAVGVERILLALEREKLWPAEDKLEGVFVAIDGAEQREEGLTMLYLLREKGLKADTDYLNRSLKAQMKFAHRNRFRYVIIFGKEEKLKNEVKLRDMLKGEQLELSYEKALNFLI